MHREELGLSLFELSDLSGVSVEHLRNLEAGRGTIPLKRLHGLSNYLRIPPSVLIDALQD
jgi:transcriptional regulator with XRE-family HTH domain